MKSSKNALIYALLLLTIKDALLGSFLLFNLNWILSHAAMTYSDDVKTMASFFGVCVLIVSTLCITAIGWVSGNKSHAIFLSKFIAWWMIVASIIVYFKIEKLQWSIIDFITGVLILIPAYIYERKMNQTQTASVTAN